MELETQVFCQMEKSAFWIVAEKRAPQNDDVHPPGTPKVRKFGEKWRFSPKIRALRL